MDEVAGEDGVLVSVARTILEAHPFGGDAEFEEKAARGVRLGRPIAEECRRAAGENQPRLRKTPRERHCHEHARARFVEGHRVPRGADFLFDCAAEDDDAGGRRHVGWRLRKAILERPQENRAHRPQPAGEIDESGARDEPSPGARKAGEQRDGADGRSQSEQIRRRDERPQNLRGIEEHGAPADWIGSPDFSARTLTAGFCRRGGFA